MKNEIWKPVKGYEGLYEVSSIGRVKGLERYVNCQSGSKRIINEKMRSIRINRTGYCVVDLSKHGNVKTHQVHQLVVCAFLDHKQENSGLVCNHKNYIRNDNRLENLEIVTNRENTNKKHLKSSSKYTGVRRLGSSEKWKAQITINGKEEHLGTFVVELKASEAYETALSNHIASGGQ